MNRDEVLERSRKEKKDEGMVSAQNTGRKIGYLASTMMYFFLIFFNMYIKESVTTIALHALFWVFFSSEAYAKYRFTKKRRYLVLSIVWGISSLIFLLLYTISLINDPSLRRH